MLVKDFIVVCIVVFFIEHPYLQLVPTLVICLSSVVLLLKYKPYTSKMVRVCTVFNELAYAVLLGCYLIINIAKGSMSVEGGKRKIGYFMILVVVLVIVINTGIAVMEILKSARQ